MHRFKWVQGRAAAEWPEMDTGRRLVELYLIWKTSSGNLERRFRRFAEVHCAERARLLDTSVEECSLVEQAPSSELLRTWLDQQVPPPPARRWYRQVLEGQQPIQKLLLEREPKAERRDKGIQKVLEREPKPEIPPNRDSEAAFGRKRAAAVDAMVAASSSKRRRILAEADPDLAALAQEVARGPGEDPVTAATKLVASVTKRREKARERFVAGAAAAAKARSKRQKKVIGSATPGPAGQDLATARSPGIMLVPRSSKEACSKAQRLRFRLVHDPVDFLDRVAEQESKAARRIGNVVLVETADTKTDFGIAAKIAAAFTGAFFTTPIAFAQNDSPKGIQYTEKLRPWPPQCLVGCPHGLVQLVLHALVETPAKGRVL